MKPTLVIGGNNGCELYNETRIYVGKIIPDRVIQNKTLYEITYLSKEFHLEGFEVVTELDKVINVRVFGIHPNIHPDTTLFCLPDYRVGVPLTDDYLNSIITSIKTYYFDNAYFNHTGKDLKYKKIESFYLPAETLRSE